MSGKKIPNTIPNKRKHRKEKKEKNVKSVDDRIAIVNEAYAKLVEVNLAAIDDDGKLYSGFEGIEEFLKILNEYKKPGILSGFSGVIKLPEMKRNIEYILPLQKFVDHGVRLVSDEEKDYQV